MRYIRLPDALKLTPEHKQFLRDLTIDPDHPGSILRDFTMVIEFARSMELHLTAKHQFPLRVLADINSRLTHPIELGLQRPQQKSYPHIHGLYLLVRASGLTRVDVTGKQPRLEVDDDTYQQWQALNPTEQYGVLLEAWLLRGRPEIIGEWGRLFEQIPDNFEHAAAFYARLPDGGLPVAGNRAAEEDVKYHPGTHNLGLLDLFGLIQIQSAPPVPGQGWQIGQINRTPLGDALVTVLYAEFFSDFDNIHRLEDAGKVPFGALQPVLQPYFAAWQNNLPRPEWQFRQGTYIFKVALATDRA